jgi:hypothetical protein
MTSPLSFEITFPFNVQLHTVWEMPWYAKSKERNKRNLGDIMNEEQNYLRVKI